LKYAVNAPTCFGLTKPPPGSFQSAVKITSSIENVIFYFIYLFIFGEHYIYVNNLTFI